MPTRVLVADREGERAELARLDREWCEAVADGNVELALTFWADDAVLLAPGELPLHGKAAIRNYVAKSFQVPGFAITWTTDLFTVSLAGDMAYGIGTNETSFTGPDGEPVTVAGKSATVWRKDPDGWKCVLDVWNDAPPPAA